MQTRKFSLGLRFDIMAGEEGQATPAQIWEEIFSVLTTNDTKGLQLYGGMVSFDEYSPADPCYLCVLTNGSLKQMRRVYAMLDQDEGIGMYLTATHPFLQNNALEKVEGLTYYGKVQSDGALSGGDEPLFDLRICKKRGRRRPVGKGIVFLLAPDSFFHFLSSKQAIRRLTLAARRQIPGVRILPLPIANGGPGTVDAILMARNGTMRKVQITGPQGGKQEASYAVLGGRTAVIEMPEAFCGVTDGRLHSSFGMGELIRRALDEGLSEIVIGLTPGCINDGGLGCLRALGMKLLNAEGAELNSESENVVIAKIDTELLHPRIRNTRFVIMTDDTERLKEEALYEPMRASYANLIKEAAAFDVYAQPGTGAAGGLGAALLAFFGATCQSGIEALLNVYEFDRRAKNVSLILTGEGCVDQTSFAPGRAVGTILTRASRMKVPVCVVAGHLGEGGEELLQKRDCSSMVIAEVLDESSVEALVERFDGAAERMFRFIRLGREIERVSARKNKR